MTATLPARRVAAPRRRPPASRRTTSTVSRSELRLMPRPRATANAIILLVGLIAVLMLAAVVLHTRIAERQIEIDRLQGEVVSAQERFDVLRQQRAELRSPTRLAYEATALGLAPPPHSNFVTSSPADYAAVLVAAGRATTQPPLVLRSDDPLDQIRRVRQAGQG